MDITDKKILHLSMEDTTCRKTRLPIKQQLGFYHIYKGKSAEGNNKNTPFIVPYRLPADFLYKKFDLFEQQTHE